MADDDKKTDDKTDPWEKLAGVVDAAVERSMTKWRESQSSEKSDDKTDETTEDEKPKERKKGFLESFFQGLD